VQVEIDPMVGAAPLGTTEEAAIERACRGKIVDREGEVEGREHRPVLSLRAKRSNPALT